MAYAASVVAVSTTNKNVSSPSSATFDGINLASQAPCRVLLVNQNTPHENGVWIFNGTGTPMTRPTAAGDPFQHGAILDNATQVPLIGGGPPNAGKTWGGSTWWVNTPATGAITVDTTAITLLPQNARPVQARLASSTNLSLSAPGVIIDGKTVTDGAMTTGGSSTTLTCATSQPFTSADVGKSIVVAGAGAAGAALTTTIAGFTSSSVVTLTLGCSTSVTGATVQYGFVVNVGDVVLLLGQTSGGGAADNGIYTWNGASTAMTRTNDFIYPAMKVNVSEGNTLAHTEHLLAVQGTITLGTTNLTFSRQFVAANATDFASAGADFGLQVNAAIQALPATGGTVDMRGATGNVTVGTQIVVDRPVRLQLGHVTLQFTTSGPGIYFTKNAGIGTTSPGSVIIDGLGRNVTTLVAPSGQAIILFDPSATWPDLFSPGTNPYGSPYVALRRMTLQGNGVHSCVFDTSNLNTGSPANFTSGHIEIEENFITGFDTDNAGIGGSQFAIVIGQSVLLAKIRKNIFNLNLGGCISLYPFADARIEDNEFLMGFASSGTPSYTYLGPSVAPCVLIASQDVMMRGNLFAKAGIADTGGAPDIMLTPDASSMQGGELWLVDNKFGGEGEALNSDRSRLQVAATSYVSADTTVRGNHFFTNAALPIAISGGNAQITCTSSGGVTTATVTLSAPGHGIPASPHFPSPAPLVGICGVGPGVTNGTIFTGQWTVTSVVSPTTFTCTMPVTLASEPTGASTAIPFANPGVVLLNGAAINLGSSIDRWEISANLFSGYGILVLDGAALGDGDGRFGESLFGDNRVLAPMSAGEEAGPFSVFMNGGRQFTVARLPGTTNLLPWDTVARNNETPGLGNLLEYSENMTVGSVWLLNSGPGGSNPTVAPVGSGLYDPWDNTGTSHRAWSISRDGKGVAQSIAQFFTTGFTLGQKQIVTKFWASAGAGASGSTATSTVLVGVIDNTGSIWQGELKMFNLGPGWKEYKFVTNGLSTGTSYRIEFYPVSSDLSQPTTIYLAGVQVWYLDSDYYPTYGAAGGSDSTLGNRFERSLAFGPLSSLEWASGSAFTAEVGGTTVASLGLASGDLIEMGAAGTLYRTGGVTIGAGYSAANPGLSQAQLGGTSSTPAAGFNLVVAAQQGQNTTSGHTDATGGDLLLCSGAPGTGGTAAASGSVHLRASGPSGTDVVVAGKQAGGSTTLGFFAATPVTKPTVTGSRGGNAALTSLLAALASLGILTDSST